MPHADLQRRVAAMRAPWAEWFEGKDFTSDWVSAHAGTWWRELAPFRREGLRVLEIGSYEGRSAVFWLEYLPDSHVTCVDKFGGGGPRGMEREARFDRNVAAYGSRVRKISNRSVTVLRTLRDEDASFDVIYVDGSHRRDDVMVDCLLSWPLLRPGGIMILDDYLYELDKPPADRPRDAIDAFLGWHADELVELSRGYQIVVRRRPDGADDQRK